MTRRNNSFLSCILFVIVSHVDSFISFSHPALSSFGHHSQLKRGKNNEYHVTTIGFRLMAQQRDDDISSSMEEDDIVSSADVAVAMEEEEEEEDSHHDNDTNPSFSQHKWKKKRYMMMKDIDDLIHKGDSRAPHKAQDLIHRMQVLYNRTGIVYYKPTVKVYNLWINAIAKCSSTTTHNNNNIHRGRDAEQVLEFMKQDGVIPTVVTFTSVMDAYARSDHPHAAQDAERVLFDFLRQQQQLSLSSSSPSKLSSITCDAVLNAWAQRGTMEAAERAQFLLERLEQFQNKEIRPTAHSYATVIHAWALCGQAQKAEAILQRLLERPTSDDDNDDDDVKLDTVVCNAVLHAWATSGDPQAGTRALELFHRMQQWTNDKRYDTHPDVVTYNTLLSAWSHSGHIKAAPQAEKILQDMMDAHEQDPQNTPSPNTVSYNSVLHAWSRSTLPGAPQRAQSVLEFMIRSAQKNNQTEIAPDIYSFTSVLNAWAKSKEPNKAIQARDLLQTMLLTLYDDERHRPPELQPTQVPFNAVLNACAFSALGTTDAERRQAMQVAVSTFAQLRQSTTSGPDTVSYGNLLKCIANLIPVNSSARHKMALETFRQCCDDGLVGELVWTEIQRAVPARILSRDELLGGVTVGGPFRALPRSWKRNVLRNQNKKTQQDEESAAAAAAAAQRQKQQQQGKGSPKEATATDLPTSAASTPIQRLRSITESSYSSRDV